MDQGLDVTARMRALALAAREASRAVARADTATKNRALLATAAELRAQSAAILAANAQDVAQARAAGRDAAFVDRLTLTPARVEAMAEGVEQVAALEDPVGRLS